MRYDDNGDIDYPVPCFPGDRPLDDLSILIAQHVARLNEILYNTVGSANQVRELILDQATFDCMWMAYSAARKERWTSDTIEMATPTGSVLLTRHPRRFPKATETVLEAHRQLAHTSLLCLPESTEDPCSVEPDPDEP